MAKKQGWLQELDWNGTTVGGEIDATCSIEVGEMDASEHGNDYGEFLPGKIRATVRGQLHWNESDTAQAQMAADAFNRQTRSIAFRMEAGGGLQEYTGTGFLTSWEPTGPNEETGKVSFAIRFAGQPSKGSQ